MNNGPIFIFYLLLSIIIISLRHWLTILALAIVSGLVFYNLFFKSETFHFLPRCF